MRRREILRLISLICIPSMVLFVLIIISYIVFIRTGIVSNIYIQIVLVYGIPIIISLWRVPIFLVKKHSQEIGLCANRKRYQDVIAILGTLLLTYLFFANSNYDTAERGYILQFIFVGIGEEIFFRSILYEEIKQVCGSKIIAVIIVAFIFAALFHVDGGMWALIIIRIPLSIIFSVIYIKTGSLFIPIILHSLYNILI